MAREEVVWCEVHYRKPGTERVLATTHQAVLDRTERGLDLCDECWSEHLKPFEDFITTYGFGLGGAKGARKKSLKPTRQSTHAPVTDDDKNADGAYACRYDTCDRTFKSPSALGVHLARFTHEPTSTQSQRPAAKKTTAKKK